MNAVAVKNSYNKEQSQMTNKHLNKKSQWDDQRPLHSKSPYHQSLDKKWDTAKKKLKAPLDMEAILALEEKLWNS